MTDSPGSGLSILVVEDDPDHLRYARTALSHDGFAVTAVGDARHAVRHLHLSDFDAVIADLRMPGMDGAELLRYTRLYRAETAFVMLTGHNDVSTAVESIRRGADEYLVKPVPPKVLSQSLLAAIERRTALHSSQLREKEADFASEASFLRGVQALVVSLETKDQYTRDHSKKVAGIALTMARRIPEITRRQLREIRLGALLHDIGKIGVPLTILHKQGPLTDEEWAVVRQHPEFGSRILEPVARFAPEVQRIVRHEHERWDGRGYPDQLAGEDIPLGSRLIMVADTYDAICSTRPYRKALSKNAAMKVIADGAGTQFDPSLVPVFAEVLDDLPEPRES